MTHYETNKKLTKTSLEVINVDVTVVSEHTAVMKYRPSTDYLFPGD